LGYDNSSKTKGKRKGALKSTDGKELCQRTETPWAVKEQKHHGLFTGQVLATEFAVRLS
jgi:hypothetical protein